MAARENLPAVAKLAAALGTITPDADLAHGLCTVARDVLGADGAAITLDFSVGTPMALSSTDRSTDRLEQLQDVVCEGPARDASRTGEIHVATVGHQSMLLWPHLADLAIRSELSGTFWAVPLRPARLVIGVLTLHSTSGWLQEDLGTVQLVADAIGTELLRNPDLFERTEVTGSWAERSRIHQAVGMVTAQLQISADDATAVLRAHAYATGLSLREVALEVTERRLDLSDILGPDR